MSNPSPKPPRREPQVDLSGLSDHQIRLRAGVIALGERVFGARWQTDLSTALSDVAGKRVGQAQISHWVAGLRPVPEALIEPLQRLAIRAAEDLERRAAEIRADWIDPPPEDSQALGSLDVG